MNEPTASKLVATLIRELGSPKAAARYAERVANCQGVNATEYATAATVIRAYWVGEVRS